LRWLASLRSRRSSGLGQASSTQLISSIATAGAATTTSLLVALGAITGPVGAVIGGLIAVGGLIASAFKGCGQTCIAASNIANQVEPYLKQNLQTYLAAPVHYASLQAAALNNFMTAWSALTQACSNPQLQSAGQNCISDRAQGSCSYHTSPGGWQQTNGVWNYVYPGANNSGSACWNWWVGYHDPIADDPTVVPDPAPAASSASQSAGGSILSTIGVSPTTQVFGVPLSALAIPALLVLAALLVAEE